MVDLEVKAFWRELAQIRGVYCTFSIDGLEDTNHIYRVGVDWDKLERNFIAFIKAGGKATWKYLIFDHNKHQTKQASKWAKMYGFSRFDARMSMREPPNLYKTLDNDNIDFMIPEAKVRRTEVDTVESTEDINCKSLESSRIYLNGEGRIWPCCYTSQRYCKSHKGYPDVFEKDNPYLFNHYNKGFNLAEKNTLQFILQHGVFEQFQRRMGKEKQL